MEKLKKCAVCGDVCQTNIKLGWRRKSDKVLFHICFNCALDGKVCEDNVSQVTTDTTTTYDETTI